MYLRDGRRVAVEVTRHNLPATLAALAEVVKRDWRFRQLTGDWMVGTIDSPNVGALHAEVGDLLARFEAGGLDSLLVRDPLFDDTLLDDALDDDEREDRSRIERARRGCLGRDSLASGRAKRVPTRGRRRLPRGRGLDWRHGPGWHDLCGGRGRPHRRPRTAGGQHGEAPGRVATRDESHLFIWVESSQHAAAAAIGLATVLPGVSGMPDRAPALPEFFDAILVATAYAPSHLWRYHRAEGWRDLGTRDLLDADYE
ncbi:MAG: hypothetical protein ACRD1K_19630 [Acidimicrobiales bacterium]